LHVDDADRQTTDILDRIRQLNGTQPMRRGQIDAFDLIGQPTWINYQTVSIKTVMRGDLAMPCTVTLPQTLMTLTEGAVIPGMTSDQRTNASIPGQFLVMDLLHIGDFRNPDGNGWSTNIQAVQKGATEGQTPTAEALNPPSLPMVIIRPPPGGWPSQRQ
jgi:hypothetical protein